MKLGGSNLGGRTWKKEDEEYLINNWGRFTVEKLCKHLKRTKRSIRLKANRLQLGRMYSTGEWFTTQDISNVLGVPITTVHRWISLYGLKSIVKPLGERQVHRIEECDLLNWLKHNQDKWNSRSVEFLSLGFEEEWMREKRRKDSNNNHRRKYTDAEDKRIRNLYMMDKNSVEIAKEVGRTPKAIRHRLNYLRNNNKLYSVERAS